MVPDRYEIIRRSFYCCLPSLLLIGGFSGLYVLGPLETAAYFSTTYFLIAAGTIFLGYICAWFDRFAFSPATIIGVGFGLRFIGLWYEPSDDIYRYLWEGSLQHAGYNPYLHAPNDPQLFSLRPDWHGRINQPELSAAYGPVAQTIFYLQASLGSIFGWKCLLLLAEMAALYGLCLIGNSTIGNLAYGHISKESRCCKNNNKHLPLALYWLHPALIFAGSWRGHLDIFLLPLLIYGFYGLSRNKTFWIVVGSFLIALCGGIKLPFYILLLPLTIFACKSSLIAALSGMVLGILLPALPYYSGGAGWEQLRSVLHFGNAFSYNSGLFAPIAMLIERPLNRAAVGLLYLAICIYLSYALRSEIAERRNAIRSIEGINYAFLLSLGWLLLMSPTVHPWYAIWLIPGIALYVSYRNKLDAVLPWLLFTLTSQLAYVIYILKGPEQDWRELPVWLRVLEFGPVVLLLMVRFGRAMWIRRLSQF